MRTDLGKAAIVPEIIVRDEDNGSVAYLVLGLDWDVQISVGLRSREQIAALVSALGDAAASLTD